MQLPTANCKPRTRRGFTLVESLVYSALLALFIGSTFIMTTQILESSRKDRSKLEVSEEAEFLFKKIEWALIDAATTTLPSAQSTGTVLRVEKTNFASNPIEFTLSNGSVSMSRGGGAALSLNSDRVMVTELVFGHERDDTNGQSLVTVTLTVENVSGEDETIFYASTTLQGVFRI